MITVFDNDDNVFNAIKAGADGYLLKETKAEKIHQAIQETLAGGAVNVSFDCFENAAIVKKSKSF